MAMNIFVSFFSLETIGLSVFEIVALLMVILIASVIRGYAGFGFSAIVVASASLFLPTREIVPLVLLLEVTASLQMAINIWKSVNWQLVFSILIASFIFIPLGQWVLLWVDVEPMRIITAVLLLLAVTLTATGRSFPLPNNPKGWFLIGTVSGFMNGLMAMGGMWAMIFLLGSGIRISTLRASLVALFFITDCYAIASGLGQGLINSVTLKRFIWVFPVLLIGIQFGVKKFDPAKSEIYRKVVFSVLSALAMVLVVRNIVIRFFF
ncbi:MAG: sulfite exporter TauE/SafE family protein [Deltaproteobacteria bacterium]|jgi:uncharacterized protein|nr:sulfite exporter TauE/SafE family protein [Deltaproteobacteria bacterium]